MLYLGKLEVTFIKNIYFVLEQYVLLTVVPRIAINTRECIRRG